MSVTPGSPQWERRVTELLAAEHESAPHFYYISFASDTAFLGGVVVHARGPTLALMRTHQLCINPGGQALTFEIPDDIGVPADAVNRLLSKEDVERLIGAGRSLGEYAASDDPEDVALVRRILES